MGPEFQQSSVHLNPFPMERFSTQFLGLSIPWTLDEQGQPRRKSHSDISHRPNAWDATLSNHSVPSTVPTESHLNESGIRRRYFDSSVHWSDGNNNLLATSHTLRRNVASWPDGSGTSPGSSPIADCFDAQTSEHYFQPAEERTSSNYIVPYPDAEYQGSSILAGSFSTDGSATPSIPPNWVRDFTLPQLSQSGRSGVPSSTPTSQAELQLLNFFERSPAIEDVRHWPQVFNKEITIARKRPTLAYVQPMCTPEESVRISDSVPPWATCSSPSFYEVHGTNSYPAKYFISVIRIICSPTANHKTRI
ncbi:hypothetical protein MVEN_01719500 [Mycena venus]|uniref:Uncharacterized protein n=1 Tax=Mycena venus TaxID=2733690 RepID=A0A8H6XPL7_9AGAR|nr:hypothetical protein MVEN_01719500 [Mycena venus]